MSRYWGYHCKTCNCSTSDDINRGDAILRAVATLAPHFKAIHESEAGDYLHLRLLDYGETFTTFLADHCGHELMLADEYGYVEPVAQSREVHPTLYTPLFRMLPRRRTPDFGFWRPMHTLERFTP